MTVPHVDRMRKLIALARDLNAPHGERQAAKRRIVLLAKKYSINYRFNEQAYEKGTKAKFVEGIGGYRKELK